MTDREFLIKLVKSQTAENAADTILSHFITKHEHFKQCSEYKILVLNLLKKSKEVKK